MEAVTETKFGTKVA